MIGFTFSSILYIAIEFILLKHFDVSLKVIMVTHFNTFLFFLTIKYITGAALNRGIMHYCYWWSYLVEVHWQPVESS